MTTVDFDFETRSAAGYDLSSGAPQSLRGLGPQNRGIKAVGTYEYARDPSTCVLIAAWSIDGGPVRSWDITRGGRPVELVEAARAGATMRAHNSAFEWSVWNECAVRQWGAAPLRLEQMECTAARCRAWGLPGALGDAAAVLGTGAQKDKNGARLIKLFSTPQRPTKKKPALWIEPADAPGDFALFVEYCANDVRAQQAISARVPPLPETENAAWALNQRVNARGVHVNRRALIACAGIIESTLATLGAEYALLTGGLGPGQVAGSLRWLAGHSVFLDSFDADAVADAMTKVEPGTPVHRVLAIRAATASASVKKVYAMLAQAGAKDDRIRGLYTYHGARTGRETSHGAQAANLPRGGPAVRRCAACGSWSSSVHALCLHCVADMSGKTGEWNPAAMEAAIALLQAGRTADALAIFHEPLALVSGVLRGMFDSGLQGD